jgi:hypothetical protein
VEKAVTDWLPTTTTKKAVRHPARKRKDLRMTNWNSFTGSNEGAVSIPYDLTQQQVTGDDVRPIDDGVDV